MNNSIWPRPLAIPGLVLLLTLLIGCASIPGRIQLPELKLSPADFAGSVSLSQRLTVSALPATSAPVSKQLDAQLEIDPARVQLAGFALGQRVLTISWDGAVLTSQRHPMLPAEIKEQRVLRDIQLVYWPAAAIQAALPPGWSLNETAGSRSLLFHADPLIHITYQSSPRWAGQAELRNIPEHYRLIIDSQEAP